MNVSNAQIIELSRSIKNWEQVLKTAMRIGGVSVKEVQIELEIDGGNFSRILSGSCNFPPDKLAKFNNIVGNILTLQWLCYQEGYEARVIPKILEEMIIEKDKELAELTAKLSYLESLVSIKK